MTLAKQTDTVITKKKTPEEIERIVRLKATKKTIKKLVKRHPNVFFKMGETNKKPLKENIIEDIMSDNSSPLEYTFDEVNDALKRYQRLFSYHSALAKLDSMRHDLQGNPIAPASSADRARAHRELLISKQSKKIHRLQAKLKYARGPNFVPQQALPKKEKPKQEIIYDSHIWDKYLIEYKDFIKTHGWFPWHSPEANETERKLAGWANTQRKLYKNKKNSEVQIKQLNGIEFIWTLEAFNKAIWMKTYDKCHAFIKKYQRLPMKSKPDEKPLNAWIKAQGRAKHEDRLSGEQAKLIAKLPTYPKSGHISPSRGSKIQIKTTPDDALKSLEARSPMTNKSKGPTITIKKKRRVVVPDPVES